jgi:hypothetical protein
MIKLGVHSPSIGTIGLGVNSPFTSEWDKLVKLGSIPQTPIHSPTLAQIDIPDVAEWQSHSVERSVEQIATSSRVTVEALDSA